MVQVKGKTEGKRIYYPIDTATASEETIRQFQHYSEGLERYYRGDWKEARVAFEKSGLEVCSVFFSRMDQCDGVPANWRGVWTMTTK
jgi:hypothetical protein